MIYCLIPSTKERRPRLEKCVEAIHVKMKYPTAIVTYENEDGCTDVGWVRAVHKTLEGINGVVFILGDDAIVEPECIEKLYEAYQALPDKEQWLLQPYEQFHKGELATFPFCHSDILKKYIYKGYKHLYSDTELTLMMKSFGRYLIVPEARVDHQHFLTGTVPMDETYKATQSLGNEDAKLFQERVRNNFEPRNI